MSRVLALGLTLFVATAAVASAHDRTALEPGQQPAQQPPPQQPPPPKPPPPPQPPEEPPVYEEQVVVTASKVEQQLVNAPATVSVDHRGRHRVDAGDQLRRAVPLGAGREPVADLGARLQHHHARRHVHAGDLARSRCSTAAASTWTSSASSPGTCCR